MECTPEQIAEKRRIALERLKVKKEAIAKAREQSSTNTANSNTNVKASVALGTSNKITTSPYQNSRNIAHPYASKMSPTNATNILNNKKEPVVSSSLLAKVISCSCYMISESRFEVNPSAYHNKLIDVFRTIPSRGYGMNPVHLLLHCTLLMRFSVSSFL